MYDLVGYAGMVGNSARTEAYVAAIRATVKPGDVVLDLGTGTGLFAMVACQSGATRVYAVESSPVIGLAQRMAVANGFGDHIRFIRGISTRLDLPEQVNVVISDLRGVLPLFGTHLPSIIDARQRFLLSAGVLIPRSDSIFLAAVEAESHYARYVDVWQRGMFGLDMSLAHPAAQQSTSRIEISEANLCTTTAKWATIDYCSIASTNAEGGVELRVTKDRTAHGIVMWFDSDLAPSIGFSGAPGQPALVYGHALFPWPQPVRLLAGETVAINVRAAYVNGDYIWSWESVTSTRSMH